MRTVIAFASCLMLGAASASAYPLQEIRLEAWAGSGPNVALLVVDFWPGNGAEDSFAFGYRFVDDQITGLELLGGIQAADVGLTYADAGGFVTDIWYVRSGVTYHTGYNWPESYWSYALSADYGSTWESAMVGPASRTLYPGDADGWLAKPGEDFDSLPVTPLTVPGDINCDGVCNPFDIDPFILALTDATAYRTLYPGCQLTSADVNRDGAVNPFDIDPFIELLTSHP